MAPAATRAALVLDPGGDHEEITPIVDRLFVGRECHGVDPAHRLIIPGDLAISRNHFEIQIDPVSSEAVIVDTSSNGTRVNGIRVERAVAVPLRDGDQIHVGSITFEFQLGLQVVSPDPHHSEIRQTVSISSFGTMAFVVGDIVDFSTVSEGADEAGLAQDVDQLWGPLRALLAEYRGTLSNYMGDALFATWELDADRNAADHALSFALAAAERVRALAPELGLRYQSGEPLQMGWGCSFGAASIRLLPGSIVTVLGDATNVAFRVAGIAGRAGRPAVLGTGAICRQAEGEGLFRFGEPETVSLKGRVGTEEVRGVFPLEG